MIVVDDADRENEGDIVFAASKATPELLGFMIRYGRGLICVPMLGTDLDRLNVPQMTSQNQEHHGTAFTISVDARHGITTGISAADRAATIAVLASPDSGHGDLVRPGHVFPLRYTEGGVLRRRGHTEAAVDLAVLAGLPPAGVVCEVIGDDGTMLRLPALREFADTHGLALITIEQLIDHRRRTERLVTRVADTVIPNRYGNWRAYGYRSEIDGAEHLALVLGEIEAEGDDPGDIGLGNVGTLAGEDVLTRVHSECLTGDVFGSAALRLRRPAGRRHGGDRPARPGGGAVPARPRGTRHWAAFQAASLRTAGQPGQDTVDANLSLGLPVDAREYSVAAQLLDDLGVRSVQLLTNNPAKVDALAAHGFGVTRIPLPPVATPYNLRYLATKRDRLGHQLDTPVPAAVAPGGRPAAQARMSGAGTARARVGGRGRA